MEAESVTGEEGSWHELLQSKRSHDFKIAE